MPDIDRVLRHGVPIVTGLVLLSVTAWVHRRNEFERAHWVEQQAKVVQEARFRDEEQWAPVVEFEANGAHVRHTGSYDTARFIVGSEVTIRFDPAAPEATVRVLKRYETLLVPTMVFMSLATVLAGVVGALRERARGT